MATRQRRLTTRPLTPERWDDLAALFGPRGACAGCWCMYWRVQARDWQAGKGAKNRRRFRDIVSRGDEPGVIAYAGPEPVGWCAVAPRGVYVRLERSRVLKPVDDRPVWSISCLFVRRDARRRGVGVALIRGAIDFAGQRGANIVEAYPVVARKGTMPDAFAWTGLPDMYERAGFREVHRHSPKRPIMRFVIR